MWPRESRRTTYPKFSKKRRSRRAMEAREKIRGVWGSSEWRRHRHVARLPLQLDGRLSPDEECERGSSAMHCHGGVCNQIAPANADERFGISFREDYRSNKRSRYYSRNTHRRRKNLRNVPRNL